MSIRRLTLPANISEFFCYNEAAWHGEGLVLAKPATLEDAWQAGALNWRLVLPQSPERPLILINQPVLNQPMPGIVSILLEPGAG
ncbi:MAG: hypothetical protein QG599_3313 [Pseudomonadota bacterium]|nr:hypothetical protein [Pseudomonadota bacterium]